MMLPQLHDGLANAATMFVAALGVWAFFLGIRARSLDGGWYGAAVLGEVLILAEGLLGLFMYLQGRGVLLSRPFMHILYGIVAVVTLPAAYTYLANVEDDRARSLVMGAVCFFLWGILLRAAYVAQHLPPSY